MKTFSVFLLLAAAFLSLPLRAQDTVEVRGVVTTVVDNAVTIASDKLGAMAYEVSAQTKVLKADGAVGKMADVAIGTTVKITTGGTPNEAIKIQVVEPKKK